MMSKSLSTAMMSKESFLSELCSADHENFIYIRKYDDSNLDSYTKIQYLLKVKNSNMLKQPVPTHEIIAGMFVAVQDKNEYFRAKVLHTDDCGSVHCFKIDDGTLCIVLPQYVFQISKKDLEAPAIAMKCRLEGMELFDGLPKLTCVYNCIKMAELDDDPYYETTILRIQKGIPLVRMSMNGISLTVSVQHWIATICEPSLSNSSSPTQGIIVHVDDKACIWFHNNSDNDLIQKIEDTLEQLDIELFDNYKGAKPAPKIVSDSWKKKYCTVPTAIFIAKSKTDGLYYRAKMTRALNKEKSQVEFIDYGNKEIIDRKSLVLAMNIDENLALVPPQCIQARLYGIHCLDVDQFWKMVPDIVDILVVDQPNSENVLEVEIFKPGQTISINQELQFEVPNSQLVQYGKDYPSSPLKKNIKFFDAQQRGQSLALQNDSKFDLKKLNENHTVEHLCNLNEDLIVEYQEKSNQDPVFKPMVESGEQTADSMLETMGDLEANSILNIHNEIYVHSSEKVNAMEEDIRDSGLDTLTSAEIEDLEAGDKFNISPETECLILKTQARLSQIIDTFCEEMQNQLNEIRNLEGHQEEKLEQGIQEKCKMEVENNFEKAEYTEVEMSTSFQQIAEESGIGSDTSEEVIEPLDLRINHRRSFNDIRFYQYGDGDWDFSNPAFGPEAHSDKPQNKSWNFVVSEQHINGYFSLQSLENVNELKQMEETMNSYYANVSRNECPSVHAFDLKNNGYYAMFSKAMKRWVRIKLLRLPEEELLICLPICLIDYGKYEKIEAREWMDIRPLKKKFLKLPMQGFTASVAGAEDVIPFLMTSPLPNAVPIVQDIQTTVYYEGKAVKSYVFSYSEERMATFPHLKVVFLEFI